MLLDQEKPITNKCFHFSFGLQTMSSHLNVNIYKNEHIMTQSLSQILKEITISISF